ncbi:hypothetical protein BGZ63DRAFT_438558 [Mariannaea sp. PMI_226]|nr:hypothetical protein BGZ63DRAFT_438558 [Mariannaea sp. PMI_226]
MLLYPRKYRYRMFPPHQEGGFFGFRWLAKTPHEPILLRHSSNLYASKHSGSSLVKPRQREITHKSNRNMSSPEENKKNRVDVFNFVADEKKRNKKEGSEDNKETKDAEDGKPGDQTPKDPITIDATDICIYEEGTDVNVENIPG